MKCTVRGLTEIWLALAVSTFTLATCARTSLHRDPNAVVEILWLPPLAVLHEDAARPMVIENGRSIYVDGSGAVAFTIAGECDDVVPTDSNGLPVFSAPQREWRGEWESRDGDIVSYVVGGAGQQLHGYASYVPRDVVKASARRLGR